MTAMREALEAAFDEHADDDQSPAPVDTPVDTAPEPVEAVAPTETAEAKPSTVRDALGRFVPKAADTVTGDEKPPAAPQADASAAPAEAVAAPESVPAPQSWSAVAREEWTKLSPALQQYITQREQSMQRFVGETGHAREVAQRFQDLVQPFMPAIQAEGADPFTAVQNLLQIGSRMRFGTPAEKAQTVAQIVKAYSVDIEALDGALAGIAPQPSQQGFDPSIVQQHVQQALAPIMQAAQARQQQAQQQAVETARTELQSFASDGKHEFLDDVRPIMADLIETGERHGRRVSLQEAYDAACRLHPDVQRVMMARQQAQTAQNLTKNAQRAKAAAVSVRGSAPVVEGSGQPTSLRGTIEAALEAHSRY